MSLTAPSTSSSSKPATGTKAALTVVIPTLNESARIIDALADLSWVSEVIVVDGGSTDETAALAREAGAKVLIVTGETIAGQRNAGIAVAEHQWVLALDADERVTPELRGELSAIAVSPRPRHAAYRMRFRNHYLGRELEHGPWGRDWHVRFFTRERRWITNRVHEHLEHVDDVGTLSGTILHYPYRDISHHVAKIVKYAQWGAEDLRARGRTAGLWEIAMRPGWRFFRDYILYSGWRDGTVGFIASALSGFAAFLKYAFLFEKSREAS
jgi:glycosyltransferase involved in cell wall biosynthesis